MPKKIKSQLSDENNTVDGRQETVENVSSDGIQEFLKKLN